MSLTTDELRARFERTLAYGGGTHSVDDIVRLVREGRARWWSKGDGHIVTELLTFPRLKACNFWLITGVLPDCLALDAEICEWARGEGCDVAMASGRKGWGRVSAPLGWRHRMHQFWKPLR